MRNIIFILAFIPGIACAQTDTIIHGMGGQTVTRILNQTIIRSDAAIDSFAVYRDSINYISVRSIANEDSATAISARSLSNKTSIDAIEDVSSQVSTNTTNIANNTTNIATNAVNINTNATNIANINEGAITVSTLASNYKDSLSASEMKGTLIAGFLDKQRMGMEGTVWSAFTGDAVITQGGRKVEFLYNINIANQQYQHDVAIYDSSGYPLEAHRLDLATFDYTQDTGWIVAGETWANISDTFSSAVFKYIIGKNPNDSIRYWSSGWAHSNNDYKRSVNYTQPTHSNNPLQGKTGGMMWRHDNWYYQPAFQFQEHKNAIETWLDILEKYNFKATLALNEWNEALWSDVTDSSAYYDVEPWGGGGYDWRIYKDWWRDVQARGHDVADHGPDHTNYSYWVPNAYRVVSESTPGVATIDSTSSPGWSHVICDTISKLVTGYSVNTLTQDGFDVMMKRGQRMFEFIGLNPFTYRIEGGGQGVTYSPDSQYVYARKNNVVGGSKWYEPKKYKHMGFNPPLDWVGKSEYFMDWNSTEAISIENLGNPHSARNWQDYTAEEAITKLVNQSARHTLTIFRQHVAKLPQSWYLGVMDSVLSFAVQHPAYIKSGTGTEWAEHIYQGTFPIENVIPKNPSTGQVFEDDIDSNGRPDGWEFGLNDTCDTDNTYHTDGGSQGSKGYMEVAYGVLSANRNLVCERLYGLDRGLNNISIDLMDVSPGTNDYVDVYVYMYRGETYGDLSADVRNYAFPCGDTWATQTDTLTIPYDCSYMTIYIYANQAPAYIDELVIKKAE